MLKCAEEVNNILEILISIWASNKVDFHIIFVEAEDLLGEQVHLPRQCANQQVKSKNTWTWILL